MGHLPLQGIRVIDFGWVWAAPALGQLLADFGAEVIKVESHRHLDTARALKPTVPDLNPGPESSALHHHINRGKLSLAIDLRSPEGVSVVRRLVGVSDVVIENFSPRVLPQYGLGYEDLCQVKPDIILASLSAAGQNGPIRDVVTYGTSLSGLAGLDSMVGYYDENVVGMQTPYPDPTVGTMGVFATMSALMYRERTGKGQHIDMSQWEATSTLMGEAIMDCTMNGRVHGPMGNRHRSMAPHGCYPCRGEDAWITIAVDTEEEWQALCRTMGDPPWSKDARFADMYARLENRGELDAHLAEWTRGFPKLELQERLQAAGLPAMAVYNQEDRFLDPHWNARGSYVPVPHPLIPGDILYGVCWKLSETPGMIRQHAPLIGEHNEHVLCDLLGLDKDTFERMMEEKVLY